ncbi:MAG: HD domain-containing protein [Acidimicrobiia bacterium]
MAEPEIHLSKRFFKATEWAAARHEERFIGPPATPSLGQVLGIASLLLEDGAAEREAIAAMLLDAIGDDDVPTDEIRECFGKKVTRLVMAAADARTDAGRGTRRLDAETWRERRARSLEGLQREGDAGVLRVRAADALRDLRAFLGELRRHGSIAFARFPAPPAEHLDHYQTLVDAFSVQLPRTRMDQALRGALIEMERLVELDTATAAWRVAHVDAA